MTNVWWVGAYIEAGMGASGSGQTAYLPFVFSDPDDRTQAAKDAAAKLLSGPYSTQAAAQNWATAYEKNPATVHAGSDIPSGPGQPFTGTGTGPGGTGTVKGDTPPAPSITSSLGDFLTRLTSKSTWIRVAEVLLGAALIIVSAAKLFSGTPAGRAATKIGMKAAIL